MAKKITAEDMQAIHDFALQLGASVKFWDKARTSLIIAREHDAEKKEQTEEPGGSPERDDQQSDACYGQ